MAGKIIQKSKDVYQKDHNNVHVRVHNSALVYSCEYKVSN